ncbi:TRAP transporter small permease [Halalkalibacter nanhaiisediminis]|uniref:C4-dicarboxylate transporter DctQ subunit n=1 Tax=Halalkalibacter nanhaiisediminis TaxID=688079 RepID=A0A562QDH5_9BACI|nr:TRAP transporter small permease [Halalkalibacter nanhaiisediminis]TWI54743.1 C4-dicarboxylate transporter DctQ subunit [Halalkalibacter nanhaiisediminis]
MKVLSKIENIFTAVFLLAGTGISLYSVFMRYVVGSSQSWATEIFTMLFVWAIFIGFSTALRDDSHIVIDVVYDRVGPGMKKVCEIVTLIVGTAFSAFFIWAGMDMVLTAYAQGIRTIDVGVPIWITYLIMPIAGVLLLIRFIEKAYRFFTNKVDLEKGDEAEWQQ